MATENKRKPAQNSASQAAFAMPPAYTDRTLPRLRNDFAGDWWLNVNYVNGGICPKGSDKH